MRKASLVATLGAAALAVGTMVGTVIAGTDPPLSGAIFTTDKYGDEVNANIYDAKCDEFGVYLDGGPGPGAPVGAAGLPDGDYYYQVTDPSGKTLLSTDEQKYRQVTVSGGVFTSRVAPKAAGDHEFFSDLDHSELGAITVELCPFLDTPNNGGEYKVWLTPVAYFAGDPNIVDNGYKAGTGGQEDSFHGFIPSFTKTDNFKVKDPKNHNTEIDTQFISEATGLPMNGIGLRWIDTKGASNRKWSYTDATIRIDHYAHVEAPEAGTHKIEIKDQLGCRVNEIHTKDKIYKGAATVPVTIRANDKDWTKYIIVYCFPN
jgi:hypothetical protein